MSRWSSRPAGSSGRRAGSPSRLLPLLLAGFLVAAASTGRAADPPEVAEDDSLRALADHELIFDTNLGLIERATEEAVLKALDGLKLPPGSEIRLHSLTNHEAAWFVEDHIARFLSDRGYKIYLAHPEAKAGPGAGPGPVSGGQGSLADVMRTGGVPSDSAGADSAALAAQVAPPAADRPPDSATTQVQRPRPTPGTVSAPGIDVNEELNPIPEGEGLVLTFRLIEFGVTYHDSWRRGFMGQRVVERLASVNVYCRLVSGTAENVVWVGSGKSDRLDIVPKSRLDLLEGLSYPFKKPVMPGQPISRILEPVLVVGIIGGLVFLFYSNQN